MFDRRLLDRVSTQYYIRKQSATFRKAGGWGTPFSYFSPKKERYLTTILLKFTQKKDVKFHSLSDFFWNKFRTCVL